MGKLEFVFIKLIFVSNFYNYMGYASGTNLLQISKCPDPDFSEEFSSISQSHCTNVDETLHCQQDHSNNVIYSICATPLTCDKGTRANIDTSLRRVSCEHCTPQFYQPVSKESYKFTQPNCDHLIKLCNKTNDRVLCAEASADHNYKCRCDNTLGFRPTFDTEECRKCFSSNTECDCHHDPCNEGKELNEDYECVLKKVSSTPLPTLDESTNITSRAEAISEDELHGGAIAGIIVTAVLIMGIPVAILVWQVRKKKSAREKDSCSKPESFKAGKEEKEDNEIQGLPLLRGEKGDLHINQVYQTSEPIQAEGLDKPEFAPNPSSSKMMAEDRFSGLPPTSGASHSVNLSRFSETAEVDVTSMDTVASYIAKDWKQLGRKLGLADGELDTIWMDHNGHGQKEVVYQMLLKWKQSNDHTLYELAKACCDIGRSDVCHEL